MQEKGTRQQERTETVSLILEDRQIQALKTIQAQRSTPYAKASLASVAREVIDRGLDQLSAESNMILNTSTSSGGQAA